MKYLVAVSGGVDSVVLLDMLVREGKYELVVGHFDHGIRDDSAADARFVEALAGSYGLDFVSKREDLGIEASEDEARQQRYAFLHEQASARGATLVTAHHADDLVETIAINLARGTGWRGLAVFGNDVIVRPLITKRKQELYDYALRNNLEWVEDTTNHSDRYLRNRLRHRLAIELSSPARRELIELYNAQKSLTAAIDQQSRAVLRSSNQTSRYFFTAIDRLVALELLRHLTKARLTRPQRDRLLLAIKTARSGSFVEPGDKLRVRLSEREFFIV